jgi:hypothetical protein
LPEDMVRREANLAKNERQRTRKQKKWLNGIARAATKARGEGGPLLSWSPQETMKRTKMRRRGR